MGRRRLRQQRYDAFEEQYTVAAIRDDRPTAKTVKNEQDLTRLARANGIVADKLWENKLIEFGADGKLRTDQAAITKASARFTAGVREERFYGLDHQREGIQNLAETHGITEKQAANMYNWEQQAEAIAILSAANAGKVTLSPHEKGILQGAAAGKWDEIVWGKVRSDGRRRYEKGTWKNRMYQGTSRARYADSGAEARAQEKADILLKYRFGDSYGRGGAKSSFSWDSPLREVSF